MKKRVAAAACPVVVVGYWRMYEETKYKRNSWDNPPLVMSIGHTYEVWRAGKLAGKAAFEMVYREPSESYGKDKEKATLRQACGLKLYEARQVQMKKLAELLANK